MSNLQQTLTKLSLKSFQTDKKSVNRSVIIGSIVATLIAGTPFFFYLYEYVPNTESWETWFFTYTSGFYGDAQIGIWAILQKLVPLVLLLMWFFTCRHWWYHALLVPIAMFFYQIFGAINEDIKYFDEFQLIYLVPLMALIFPSIYLIRAKMFNKINDAGKSMEELEEEFMIKPKGFLGKWNDYF